MIRNNGAGGGGGSRRCLFEDVDMDAGQHRRGRLRGGRRIDNVIRRDTFHRSCSSGNDIIAAVVVVIVVVVDVQQVTQYYDYDGDDENVEQ